MIVTKTVFILTPFLAVLLAGCESQPSSADTERPKHSVERPEDKSPIDSVASLVPGSDGRWKSESQKLDQIINDVAFQKQRFELVSFYSDAALFRDKHRKLLQQALNERNESLAATPWVAIGEINADLTVINNFVSELQRVSKDDAMLSINSFTHIQSDFTDLRPLLIAYKNAGTEVESRYHVDLGQLEHAARAVLEYSQRVADYVSSDDYISAYAVVIHTQMLVHEARFELDPFKYEVYRRSHPASR